MCIRDRSTDDLENVEREMEAGGTEGPAKAAPEKKFGYVAVCAGAGLEAVFRDLGVDGLVGGGQTMNPSTAVSYTHLEWVSV